MSTIMIHSISHSILSGPEPGRLWDAAKYAYNKDVPELVFFEIKNPFPDVYPEETLKIRFRPISIQHEDGSGRSFNVEGFISSKCYVKQFASRRFTAYYNAGSPRHGILKIIYNN